MKHCKLLLLTAIALLLQACSGGTDPVKDSGNNGLEDNLGKDTENNPVTEVQTITPKVYIVSPINDATVTSPVTVEFGIEGFSLAPAGVNTTNTGHHHLLVDTALPALNQPIPSDSNHLHFGKAQDATVLKLEPGEHTLQLLLGDGSHIPHTTAIISEPIVITVVTEAVE
ncbi:MAG: DUF4399 domain-containing protein [Gammaproteobacteria bacterium]|nr:DUF4399 domain-containing protein [Gammaproteobacteria bacterium]MCP4091648.1 DUF4399 domain-containing protein [Gammaproteobacteria bacterium]MCP4276144.1 DUF4399 domain-containing protein [Gammaproteobacteria bacterium]MCP4831778.1 DUF4399 domain-containing protein [Gammaproteobacteria bacterium]MCP4929714.1 DUF4399 domain-containing protein [Gammaproteobacteria bacterium]